MPELPSGTVTFLFTDVEGSTKRWQQFPEAMKAAVARHDALLRQAIEANGGSVFKTVGDAFCAAFATASDALRASVAAQRALAAAPWEETGPLRVRTALHTGEAEERDGDYFGPAVNRVARLLAVGHGDQVLLSEATQELVRDALPPGFGLRDLGEHRLKDLARPESVFQLLVEELPAEFPPLASLDAQPNNLPLQLTPFVGREEEVAATGEILCRTDVRLLTLTGPGGTGKTRLGLQVAADLGDVFPDGVWFVDLTPISDPALVAVAIAQTTGVREQGGRALVDSLVEYLRPRRQLLLLDNFEQVTEAAPLVGQLLRTCPKLKVLVTSRHALRVQGEREIAVAPLALPDPRDPPPLPGLLQNAAVRLFVERTQAVRANFALTDDNAGAVVDVCRRLDGLPLAIELAAARCRHLPPTALLARLEKRLPLLTGGSRDLPARQQTMRGAIAWSYDLLTPAEQVLFARLAVFAGGSTLEATEAVCNQAGDLGIDVLEGIASLADKSLLRVIDQADGRSDPERAPRYAMLATIREYGLEQLAAGGEEELFRLAHADYFLQLAEQAGRASAGPEQERWLERLETEHDNLRAVLAWALTEEPTTALRLAAALWWFWRVRGHLSEGRGWLERALERGAGAPAAVRAQALNGAGGLAERQGDYEPAAARYQASLTLWESVGDRRGRAQSLDGLGNVAHDGGDYARAVDLHEQALALYRAAGDRAGVARSLTNRGNAELYRGRYDQAEAAYAKALSVDRALGDQYGISVDLNNLGALFSRRGDFARARAYYEESLAVRRELGDRPGVSLVLVNLGETLEEQGALSEAATLYDEALRLARELGDKRGTADALASLGRVEQARGDRARAEELFADSLFLFQQTGDRAAIAECLERLAGVASLRGRAAHGARLFGAAEALREAVGAPRPAAEHSDFERDVATARSVLDETTFARQWAAGRALSLDEAIAEATEPRRR